MIDRKISVHLQDFPAVDFLPDENDLVKNMDLVRAICSAALSIRDNKNLRVRLPLARLKIIGKNSSRIKEFSEIIAEEVNVKHIEFSEEIQGLAELKLQINFKKIGAKYGAKVKEIMEAVKQNKWQKIDDKTIEIAGVELVDDEFELKLLAKNNDDKKFAAIALPTNDYLVLLDIEITENLAKEGIARDIIRAVQQARKDANLNVSDRIELGIFSANSQILQVAKEFDVYIKDQVLALQIKICADSKQVESSAKFFQDTKIDDGGLALGLTRLEA